MVSFGRNCNNNNNNNNNRNWREMEGIVVRYINDNGKIEEHAIGLVEAQDRSAKGLLEILMTYLADLGISLGGVLRFPCPHNNAV